MFSEKGIIHFNFEFIIEIDTHETGLVLHQTALRTIVERSIVSP